MFQTPVWPVVRRSINEWNKIDRCSYLPFQKYSNNRLQKCQHFESRHFWPVLKIYSKVWWNTLQHFCINGNMHIAKDTLLFENELSPNCTEYVFLPFIYINCNKFSFFGPYNRLLFWFTFLTTTDLLNCLTFPHLISLSNLVISTSYLISQVEDQPYIVVLTLSKQKVLLFPNR